MNYKNKDTGVIYTLEELKQIWDMFKDEQTAYATFEDMIADMEETAESEVE